MENTGERMIVLFKFLHTRVRHGLETSQEIYPILFNFWLFIIIVRYYHKITESIIVNAFYSIPKEVILGVITSCLAWSIICFLKKNRVYKQSALLANIGLYLWVAFSSARFNIFSVVAGTYFIIAFRYIVLYFTSKAREGNNGQTP